MPPLRTAQKWDTWKNSESDIVNTFEYLLETNANATYKNSSLKSLYFIHFCEIGPPFQTSATC